MNKLEEMLIRHEGDDPKAYTDSKGIWSLGIGRNLESPGLSKHEIITIFQQIELPENLRLFLLDNDIQTVTNQLESSYPWFRDLEGARRDAVIDLCFNLGINRFRGFVEMIKAFERQDYETAANECLDSQAGRELPDRYGELSQMIKTGEYQD